MTEYVSVSESYTLEINQPGAMGPQGLKGDKGDTGNTGAQGPRGDKGDKGDTGENDTAALTAHASDSTNIHGITDTAALVLTDDARLSDDRDPNAHAASHAFAGSDPVTVSQSQVTGLSDALGAKSPLSHGHNSSDIMGLGNAAAKDVGTLAGTVAAGDDSRFTNPRTPTAHAASHQSGGSDQLTLAQSQVTGLVTDLASKVGAASPTLTGVPAAPTAAVDTGTTQIATTAFVINQKATAAPQMDGAAAVGSSVKYARENHVHPSDTSRAPLASPALTGNPTAPTPAAGDNDTSIATTAFAAERATVGNLLTANQAGGISGWSAPGLASFVYNGNGSMTGTYSSTIASAVSIVARIPVVAGQTYTLHAYVTASTRNVRTRIVWYNIGGGSISSLFGDSVASGLSMATGVAPVGAVSAEIYLNSPVTGSAGDTFTVTWPTFHAGAGGEWAMPGTPITNLGTKVSHPNVDDVLVQRWDSSKATPGWQTIHYDSGWRAVTADAGAGTNHPGLTTCYLRRIGNKVTFTFTEASNSASGAGLTTVYTVPAGFQKATGSTVSALATVNPSSGAPSGGACYIPGASANVVLYRSGAIQQFGAIEWPTSAAIPTTLPGSLVSAAPA